MNKPKLKIAVFHFAFVYSGGGEKLVLEEVERLQKKGHGVDVFTSLLNEQECFPEIIKKFDIQTYMPAIPYIYSHHGSLQILISCLLIPFYAHKFKHYDIVFAANQPSLWMAWVVKKLYGIPYVSYLAQPTRFLYPRNIDKETGLFFLKKGNDSISAKMMTLFKSFIKWADNKSIRGSDAILANGSYMTDLLQRLYRVKIGCCPAGAGSVSKRVTVTARRTGNLRVQKSLIKKPYLLITNRHVSQKKFEYGLITLSSLLLELPELSLVITGVENGYTEILRKLISEMHLEEKVVFTGLTSNQDLRSLYKNAAVYLYTAPEEDFGMGVIEAMGAGTPVVAWNKAGPTGTVIDSQTGFLVSPHDTQEFTEKVLTILRNKKQAEEMSINCVARSRIFSWEKHMEIIEEAIYKVTQKLC